ncbi:MAG: site-2 protease family protein [Thermoanaerobacteraceae bacterium]|nr:site-2 protease family protein [Thermoanaerobacteraceae bacterium]
MILDYLYRLPALLIAITIHEFSHGFVANKLGDPTPKNAGRLTLNPFAHLDLLGALMLFIFRFGWAKPVPINPFYFKNRKTGTLFVSIAGPLSNFLVAIISISILKYVNLNPIMFNILLLTYWFNLNLFIFNLIPLSPLDGSHILYCILPQKYTFDLQRYETMGQKYYYFFS